MFTCWCHTRFNGFFSQTVVGSMTWSMINELIQKSLQDNLVFHIFHHQWSECGSPSNSPSNSWGMIWVKLGLVAMPPETDLGSTQRSYPYLNMSRTNIEPILVSEIRTIHPSIHLPGPPSLPAIHYDLWHDWLYLHPEWFLWSPLSLLVKSIPSIRL